MEAHLLHSVGNVKLGEGEVLYCPSKAALGRHDTNWGVVIVENLRLGVDRRVAWLAIKHVNLIQDVEGVLSFGKEELVWALLHGDPSK